MSGGLTRLFDYGAMAGAHFVIDVQGGWVRGLRCDNPGPGTVHGEAIFDAPIGVVGRDFPPNAPGSPTVVNVPANQVAVVLDADGEPVYTPALLRFQAWTL